MEKRVYHVRTSLCTTPYPTPSIPQYTTAAERSDMNSSPQRPFHLERSSLFETRIPNLISAVVCSRLHLALTFPSTPGWTGVYGNGQHRAAEMQLEDVPLPQQRDAVACFIRLCMSSAKPWRDAPLRGLRHPRARLSLGVLCLCRPVTRYRKPEAIWTRQQSIGLSRLPRSPLVGSLLVTNTPE